MALGKVQFSLHCRPVKVLKYWNDLFASDLSGRGLKNHMSAMQQIICRLLMKHASPRDTC
jgi:hypothetical protein